MPKTSIDYSKTIIYKICCKDPIITDIYIGHTTDLTNRKYKHKSNCCSENNRKYYYYVYEFIRNNGGWNNWEIVPIEECKLENIQQAKQKERYWIEELKATLNKYIPSRTMKEWRNDNKQHEKDYRKQYYDEHKDNLREKAKVNKKIYYYENKEKILEKQNCLCGSIVCKNSLNRHLKTKKHQDFINSQSF